MLASALLIDSSPKAIATPREQAAEDGHSQEGQQAGSGPGRERRLPARRKD